MKNGSKETRLKAKGCFGGSIKVERVIHSSELAIKEGKAVSKPVKKKVGRDFKGAANSRLVRKLHKGNL